MPGGDGGQPHVALHTHGVGSWGSGHAIGLGMSEQRGRPTATCEKRVRHVKGMVPDI